MSVTDVRIGISDVDGGNNGSNAVGIGGKLPRTLSTSVLRIKHRSSFWDKFGADESSLKKET